MSQITRSPILPPDVESPAEARAAARASGGRGESVFRAVGDAISSEWIAPWLLRQAGRSGYSYDPSFTLRDDETWKRLTEGLPEDLWESLENAVSMEHATRIRDQMLEVSASRERLARLGWGGTALRFGAAIFDPAAIAAGVATGGAGYVAKGGRLARMLKTGLAVGASEAAIEGYLASQDPERDAMDVLYAGAGGFVFGSVLDGLVGGKIDKAARKVRKDIELSELRQPSMGAASDPRRSIGDRDFLINLTDDGRKYFREQLTAEEQGRKIDDLIQRSGLDETDDADLIAEIRALPPEEALNRFNIPAGDGVGQNFAQYVPEGAAVNRTNPPDGVEPPFEPTLRGDDFNPERHTSARAAFTNVRRSVSSILGSVNNDDMVRAGNMYVTDSLLKRGGTAALEGADTWKARIVKGQIARYTRTANEAFQGWAKEKGVHSFFSDSAREDFMQEVGRAIRQPRGQYTQNKWINQAADAQRRQHEEIRQIGVRHAVPGFDKFDGSETYLTRRWSPSLVSKAYGVHGENFDRFLANAVLSQVERTKYGIDDAKAVRIGEGLRRKLTSLDGWTDTDRTLNLTGVKSDMLEEVLKDAGIDAETIKDVLYAVRPDPEDAGKVSVAKHRVVLDETYAEQMADGAILRIDDFLDNNAERLFHQYANQVVGASGANMIYRQFGAKDWASLRSLLGKSMDQSGMKTEKINQLLDVLEIADKHVRGIPIEQNQAAATWARRVMAGLYTMMSGGFGFAQIAELANPIMEGGFKVMAQQVDEIPRLIKGIKSGTVGGSELAEFAEGATGAGSEFFTNQFVRRFDDEIDPTAWQGNKFDRFQHNVNRLASKVSGLQYVDEFSRRWASITAAQRLVNMAIGRPLSAKRLASIGLTPEMGERLQKAIKTEWDAQRGLARAKGASGHSVKQIRLDQWADQEAAGMFVQAMDRTSRRWIQTNSLGATHPFLTKWQGKMLFQFRSFMLQAWEKQFLHRVQMRDIEAFRSMMGTMFAAGTIYMAQQQLLSVGRPDREKFLDERLGLDKVAAAAFQRAGWTSLLPSIIDTGLRLGQRDPLFTYGQTGLSRGLFSLDNNATTSTVNQALRGIGGVIGAATQEDERFGQQDARALLTLLPFSRLVGVRNVLESLAQQFPEE